MGKSGADATKNESVNGSYTALDTGMRQSLHVMFTLGFISNPARERLNLLEQQCELTKQPSIASVPFFPAESKQGS